MSEEVKVKVRNLTKKFGDLLVLDNASFDIKKGEFVCIVGPTGCGKTTFLNLLVKLIEPTSGEILIDGEPADPKKHNLSFVFQEPSAFPWLTVEKNLRFNLEIKHYPKEEIDKRVARMAKILGLEDVAKSYPRQLSASAQQRIVIGRSFAMYPDLLLMDEPYGQMDIKMRYYLEDEVLKLWRETGATVIFITHNVEEAVYLADRIILLSACPAHVKEVFQIDLPKPRDLFDREFLRIRDQIEEQTDLSL